jgi:hypothetical protein
MVQRWTGNFCSTICGCKGFIQFLEVTKIALMRQVTMNHRDEIWRWVCVGLPLKINTFLYRYRAKRTRQPQFEQNPISIKGIYSYRSSQRDLIIGPKRSGSSFLIDPNTTYAWNVPTRGYKRWRLCLLLRVFEAKSFTTGLILHKRDSLVLKFHLFWSHMEPCWKNHPRWKVVSTTSSSQLDAIVSLRSSTL